MSKHTPGPWEVVKHKYDERNSLQIRAEWHDDNILLASVGTFEVNDMEQANARLIAAAPDMYELLNSILGNSPGWREAIGLLEDHCADSVKLKNMVAALDQIDDCNKNIKQLLSRINNV